MLGDVICLLIANKYVLVNIRLKYIHMRVNIHLGTTVISILIKLGQLVQIVSPFDNDISLHKI